MDHEAAQLEKQHVHDVYESTAPYFGDLQSKAWPRVRQFLQEQKPGSLIADIGCGTGKYLKVNSQVYALGCDYCGPLVEIARSRGCEVMVCDNLHLPFRDQGLDAIISIGVIHHFSTKQRRIRAIKEMARVLVPGGQLMIYVWAMEQKNRHFEKQDVLVPWNRALCSRLLSDPSQPGRKPCAHPERSHPYHPPCSVCSCSVCFKEQGHSQRSHSMDYEPLMAGTCCADISKEGEEENGFSNMLGKSFRSWFFSRSLDESTLRKQIERVRPLKNTEGWANSTVSIQPSRHSSLDLGHQEPLSTREQSLDEDVFVEASQKQLEWPRAPAARKHLRRDQQGEVRRNGDGNFLEGANTSENSVNEDDTEEGHPSAGKTLRRISALDSTDSNSEETIPVEEQQPGILDSRAFMRYYHVFREGELYGLLKEHVAELHVLSSGNDHGNWCVIAEKKDNCD
ncbi:probable tRNA methyltransferase 9B [Mustela nigripes]|uniref:probable tRNA methyltransferase 9B isoform X1 n=2 Tax=Mustela lutreola TaxID=9666 RepID=UPI00279759E2|nr:probable tRNA methyltransferase 9B isoform X1 [Mustela lutreola]XP_059011880.1 probable tRNA methyltransferase 9B isoform X1 [Mustela lutreola]XP_059011881.1 probable tRNA methyltransferase 9B isoform X1 [Mustela lutreola]XP_059011882.1 probable tRNA methyltransferase 9B isoform X1 [Mustela lutreola]XP_059011883.1 probable tRNA methyltransferase 9B isoform X1 [Mustela lutreola]XP_059240478.1 probable tRNA methyltransferase 9B [Mustela nigripes]XP_059240479.1 probable tRNA methyltransferase